MMQKVVSLEAKLIQRMISLEIKLMQKIAALEANNGHNGATKCSFGSKSGSA